MAYWGYLHNDKQSNSVSAARAKIGAFDINSVEGRKFWIKADAETFTDVNGTTPTTDGTKVFRWNDQTEYDNDCFNITESKRPTFNTNDLNGLPTVSFVKEDSQYMIANNAGNFDIDTPTMFLVGRWNSGEAFCGKGAGSLSDARHRKLMIEPFSAGIFSWWAGTDAQSGCSAFATTTDWNIYAIRCKRDNRTVLNVNGVDTFQSTTINNTSLNEAQFTVGCGFDHGAEFGSVDIAELQLFDRVLTDYQTDEIISYLSTKWGIAIT